MSIQSEINRINGNISSAYNAAQSKGASIPATPNSANLATTIQSIPQEGSTGGGDIKAFVVVPEYETEIWGGYPLMNFPGMQQSYIDNSVMYVVQFMDYNEGTTTTATLVKGVHGFITEVIGAYGQVKRIMVDGGYLSSDDQGPMLTGLTVYYRA